MHKENYYCWTLEIYFLLTLIEKVQLSSFLLVLHRRKADSTQSKFLLPSLCLRVSGSVALFPVVIRLIDSIFPNIDTTILDKKINEIFN